MSGRRARKARKNPPWTPFERVGVIVDGETVWDSEELDFDFCLKNSKYMVFVRKHGETMNGPVHLSIKRMDRNPVHDWRDLQRIKNETCGDEREAIELYPAESRLVDTANQYHLWVLSTGERVPLGFTERLVSGRRDGGVSNAKQRELSYGKPTHTDTQMDELVREHTEKAKEENRRKNN